MIMRFILICLAIFMSAPALAETSVRLADLPLFNAAYKGDVAGIEVALKNGEDINRVAVNETPLTYAIANQKIDVVKALLAHGADANKQTPILTVLQYWSMQPNTEADETQRLEMLTLLLKAGANPNPERVAHSPLNVALGTKQMRLFAALKQAGATFGHDTPMIEAVNNNKPEVIQQLLKMGFGVDEEKSHGCTALCQAVFKKKPELVALLLKSGAKWTTEGAPYDGRTTTWAGMIVQSSTDILKQFLDAGLAVNSTIKSDSNQTLLHQAAMYSEASSVTLLVNRGAKINAQDNNGDTPLMLAALNGKLENIDVLIAAKADVSLLNKGGETAKILAAKKEHQEIVARLTKAGAVEYAGRSIPNGTAYDKEISGKVQDDVSGKLYDALPFLPKQLRFFLVHEQAPECQPVPDTSCAGLSLGSQQKTRLYAVLPSTEVVKLYTPDAFVALHLRITSTDVAQQLVKFFSDPPLGFGLRFTGVDFQEFPQPGRCQKIVPAPSTFGITPAMVTQGEKGLFTIVRFGIRQGDGDHVVKVIEKVKTNGEYQGQLTDLATPGLSIRPSCFPQ